MCFIFFISSNTTLHYGTGVSVGIMASLLVLIFILSRLLPQVSTQSTFSVGVTYIFITIYTYIIITPDEMLFYALSPPPPPPPPPLVIFFFFFFSFLHKNLCCRYSLEVPQQRAIMSVHNIGFHGEIRKKNMWIPPLFWSYDFLEEMLKSQAVKVKKLLKTGTLSWWIRKMLLMLKI